MDSTEKIRWISRVLPRIIDEVNLDVERPEEPFFSPFYNPKGDYWSASIGSNYAGYFDAEAEVPVYINRRFNTLEEMCNWFIQRLQERE